MFTKLKLSTISVIAQTNFQFNSNKVFWVCPDYGALKAILTPRWESWQRGYKRPVKVKGSARGRKKKKRAPITKTDHFGSHITFVVQRWTARARTYSNNRYKTTCILESDDPFCAREYIPKEYLIKIFNGGKIICLGILRRDKSDIKWALNIVKQFIHIKTGVPCTITGLRSTLENYKFQLRDTDYCNINLIKLQLYYMHEVNSRLINIDFDELYKIIYDAITESTTAEFNPADVLRQLKCSGERKKMFVYRDEFIQQIGNINIAAIDRELRVINVWLYNKNDRVVDNRYREWFALDYIRYKLRNVRQILHSSHANAFHNIRYRPNQSDVLVEHMVNSRRVSVKIFGSGSFNIKGCRSYAAAKQVYDYMVKLFNKIGKDVIYCENYPPVIDLDTFLITK